MTAMIILTIIVEKIIAAVMTTVVVKMVAMDVLIMVSYADLGQSSVCRNGQISRRINTGQGSCTEKSSGELLSDLGEKYVVSI